MKIDGFLIVIVFGVLCYMVLSKNSSNLVTPKVQEQTQNSQKAQITQPEQNCQSGINQTQKDANDNPVFDSFQKVLLGYKKFRELSVDLGLKEYVLVKSYNRSYFSDKYAYCGSKIAYSVKIFDNGKLIVEKNNIIADIGITVIPRGIAASLIGMSEHDEKTVYIPQTLLFSSQSSSLYIDNVILPESGTKLESKAYLFVIKLDKIIENSIEAPNLKFFKQDENVDKTLFCNDQSSISYEIRSFDDNSLIANDVVRFVIGEDHNKLDFYLTYPALGGSKGNKGYVITKVKNLSKVMLEKHQELKSKSGDSYIIINSAIE